jgi:hypothetical protein
VTTLRGEAKERWRELCERAVVEQDPDRFLTTIQQLLQVLEEREQNGSATRRGPRASQRKTLPNLPSRLSTRISQAGFVRRIVLILFIQQQTVVSDAPFH